jgi:hypothetical protein
MNNVGVLVALGAIIPIWAIEALVTDTEDRLIASVTNGSMLDIAARSTKEICNWIHWSTISGRLESMGWMMTVLVALVAWKAEIVIIAVEAGYEVLIREFLDTTVASARRFEFLLFGLLFMLPLISICTRHIWNTAFGWSLVLGDDDRLSGAVDNMAILDETFDKPVALTWAMDTSIDALLAQIIVTIIADVAMVVLVRHGLITVVAENGPRRADCWCRWRLWCFHAQSKLALVGDICELIKE